MTSSLTTALEEMTINNEQLRGEVDLVKAENEAVKDEIRQLRTENQQLKVSQWSGSHELFTYTIPTII